MSKLRALLAPALLMAGIAAAAPAQANILGENPLPRVEDRICPGVLGMSEDYAVMMLERVRYNADRIGIRQADPAICEPNLLIAFVGDPRTALAQLAENQPRLFGTLSMPERRELMTSAGPVRAWNIVVSRSRDGITLPQRDNMVQIPQTAMWSAHSKIYVATRRDIVSTVLLFDADEVKGKTLNQLADYASMRAFAADLDAHTDRDGNSILALFDDDGKAVEELSETDLAFLETLYAGTPNLPATAKERTIETALAK